MQWRNSDADIENGLVDAVWEGKGGMNGECNINIHRWPYVKQIAGEKLLCNTGSPACCSVMTYKGGMGVGRREAQGGGDIYIYAAAAAKSLQSCPTLCDPIDSSPPGSPIPGILQARTLEWVAISFSDAWKWKVKVKSLSRVWLFATPWTTAHQAPPPMGFSRQEYWSGVPLPSPDIYI